MQKISALDPAAVDGKSKELLEQIKQKLGATPNIFRTMAHSPNVLEAYLGLSGAMGKALSPKLREQIALAIAETNHCDYCLAAHSVMGKKAGLSDEDILSARKGEASDAKAQTAVKFASKVNAEKGFVSDEDLKQMRDAGFSDGEIMEVTTVVALNIFTNLINHVADTEVDFPPAPKL